VVDNGLNALTVEFEQLRVDRWQHAIEMVREAKSTSELLADIANVAMILYLNNNMVRVEQKPGFKSTSET
jgi:hypothetical protein